MHPTEQSLNLPAKRPTERREVEAEPIEHAPPPPGAPHWLRWVPGSATVLGLGAFLLDEDAPFKRKALVALSLLYLLSPIDILPEALFSIFGLADDAAVIMGLLSFVTSDAFRPYRTRARDRLRGSEPA